MKVISYGGGVQSTAMLVLAKSGQLDVDAVLFANVGDDSEHPGTLAYVRDIAVPWATEHGISLHMLDRMVKHRGTKEAVQETLWQRLMRDGSRSLPIPVRMSNGAPGTRSCTADFKIRVVGKWLIGRAYLNDTVLPALCHKAGIPESDSRGALTSHRARSTIATQLLNAPEPLSIADLKEWLGHKHFSSTRHYAAILQRRLTAAYRKADYFARNVRTIQVLIDRETILSGAAAGGEEPWKYYDLGDGYCTYDFFAKCPHRLACARCPFYLPKQSSAGQLLSVKDGVEQMLERLTLTEDERAALEGDRDALATLAERLAKVPTPAGPTPEQLGTERAFIAVTTVQDSITGGRT